VSPSSACTPACRLAASVSAAIEVGEAKQLIENLQSLIGQIEEADAAHLPPESAEMARTPQRVRAIFASCETRSAPCFRKAPSNRRRSAWR
jgi:hypothetical protein